MEGTWGEGRVALTGSVKLDIVERTTFAGQDRVEPPTSGRVPPPLASCLASTPPPLLLSCASSGRPPHFQILLTTSIPDSRGLRGLTNEMSCALALIGSSRVGDPRRRPFPR